MAISESKKHDHVLACCEIIARRTVSNLCGKNAEALRRKALEAITKSPQPLKKCGINRLVKELLREASMESVNECQAVVEAMLEDWISQYADNGRAPAVVITKFGRFGFQGQNWKRL